MLGGYQRAAEQLTEIVNASDGTVQLHRTVPPNGAHGYFHISIRFDGVRRTDGGLRVRARERFVVAVPNNFPYHHPTVWTPHERFAGFAHVQWRQHLCLYGSSADWHPEDGMYGLISRLDAWIRDAAVDNLDPEDAPLHPPVAYPTVDRLVVPLANAPPVVGSPWVGIAELRERHHRTEIIGWRLVVHQTFSEHTALAVLLHEPLPFEYPDTVRKLLDEFKKHGIQYARFIIDLASYASQTPSGSPLLIVLGTPMRRPDAHGSRRQHLAVWQVDAVDADQLRLLDIASTGGESAKHDAIRAVVAWSMSARVGWCPVNEMRSEVTRRRDKSSPMSWFLGKRIVIWGCGAIGSRVAESVVRAGAAAVALADNKRVTPGILVRQGFEDADIGRFKTDALADRLKRIAPDLVTTVSTTDLLQQIRLPDPIPDSDMLIDCTASDTLRTALESVIQDITSRPPIASIAIDATASSALATLSTANHSGATLDLVRRLKLDACRKDRLAPFLDAFWPQTRDRETFLPEPGCSEPTFVGSDADIASLSTRMLNAIAHASSSTTDHSGRGWLCQTTGALHAVTWPADHTLTDKDCDYSVRVCPHALRDMQAWANRSYRIAGPGIETGGLVFGELNEAARVLWVSEVDGPPPDSTAGADHFTCGIRGTADATRERHRRFRGSVDCVGSWHTHPSSAPELSDVDITAATRLLTDPDTARRTCLLLILSGHPGVGRLGAYAFRTRTHNDTKLQIQPTVEATIEIPQPPQANREIGLALSGGGSRAIAFHLGCLRALHDLRLLDRIQVISSVSGGSVIAAMYAYSRDPFPAFDRRVVALLRRGLQRDIVLETFRLINLLKAIPGRLASVWHTLTQLVIRFVRTVLCLSPLPRPEPRERSFTRSEAFRNVLKRDLFGNALVSDVSHDELATVINTTELRSGSAFGFGSRGSGCWRFGTIPPAEAYLADAVAASAAYPIYLPALNRHYLFEDRNGTTRRERVLLADGGIYENHGISPFEPGRSDSFSAANVFDPDYIVCCDAGTGLFDHYHFPARIFARLYRTELTLVRKHQDAARKRLHWLGQSGAVSGFVLPYLGQQDDALPWFPAGLPPLNHVRSYPTNFRAMADSDIDCLTLRGELLTRFLVSYYLADL